MATIRTHILTFAVTDDAPADLVIDTVTRTAEPLSGPKIARRAHISYDEVLRVLPFLIDEGYIAVRLNRAGRMVYGPGRTA